MQKTAPFLISIIFCLLLVSCGEKTTPTATVQPPMETVDGNQQTLPLPTASSQPLTSVATAAISPDNTPNPHNAALLPSGQAELAEMPALSRYQITLNLDYDNHSYSGESTVDYINVEGESQDKLYFRLYPNGGKAWGAGSLTVSDVTVDGATATIALSLEDTVLEVSLPQPLADGEKAQIKLTFAGTIPQGDFNDFVMDGNANQNKNSYGQYQATSQMITMAGWYPILAVYDDEGWNLDPTSNVGDSNYSDMALYEVDVTTNGDHTIVATGTAVQQDDSRFVSGPVREFSLAVSPNFEQASMAVDGTTVVVSYLPQDEDAGKQALEVAVESLRIFNEKFGAYPYNELDVVLAPHSPQVGGVEYPGLALINHHFSGEMLDEVVAHEVAHQWWYNLVGNDVIDEPWLDEALTTYSSLLYFEANNADRYDEAIAGNQFQYDNLVAGGFDAPVSGGLDLYEDKPVAYGALVYGKGALFFNQLRQEIGDEAFFAALQNYYADQKYGISSPDVLQSAFEAEAGQSLSEFFTQWLYTPPTATESVDIDQVVLQQAATIFAQFREHSDQIWTANYRLDQMPIIFVRADAQGNPMYGYLFNHPDPESVPSAQLVETDPALNLPPVYRLTEFVNAEQIRMLPFDFFHSIGETRTFLFKYADAGTDAFSAPNSADWMRFVIHEGLHRDQFDRWNEPQQYFNPDYPLDGDNLAHIVIEQRILSAALQTGDAAEREALLQQFLAVRHYRISQNGIVANLDNVQELIEGTARYIEYRYDDVMEFDDVDRNFPQTEYLKIALDSSNAGFLRDEVTFGRFYATGAAIGTLLDRIGVEWHELAENGQTPYDILSNVLGDPTAYDELLQQARTEQGYEQLRIEAEAVAEAMAKLPAANNPLALSGEEVDIDPSIVDPGSVAGGDGDVMTVDDPFTKPATETPPADLQALQLPDGFELMGAATYAFDELDQFNRPMYSPGESDVTMIAFNSPKGEMRVLRSAWEDGSLAQWKSKGSMMMPGAETEQVNGVDVQFASFDAPFGVFSTANFAHAGEWYSIEAPLDLDEIRLFVMALTE